MNFKLENIILFLLVVTEFGWTVLSFDSKCPFLKMPRGKIRYQLRGRSVRFNCMRGFQLFGAKYATCMNGKWDAEVPRCVRYGCQAPSSTHINGQLIESYRGAVVKIVCNPGYSLVGSPSVFCNGIRWNETFPVCRVCFQPDDPCLISPDCTKKKFTFEITGGIAFEGGPCTLSNTNPALSCNFEDEDFCGWSQDPMHDFDWKTKNDSDFIGETTNATVENTKGDYMYIGNSSSGAADDIARFFSPVYPPEYSNGTCFKFWYRMYGSLLGFLKVYVKPEDVELRNVIPSVWLIGDQGKSWLQSTFPITPMESPFQIVFEGEGVNGKGETAFDDVKLTTSEECPMMEAMTSSSETTPTGNPDEEVSTQLSCRYRCLTEKGNSTDDDKCSCHESCDQEGTCCSDYASYCSSPSPSTSETTSTVQLEVSTSTSSSPTPPSVTPETKPPSPKPPITFNNESNEIEPEKPPPPVPPRTTPNRTSNEIQPVKTTTPQPMKTTPVKKNETISKPGTNATKPVKVPRIPVPKPGKDKPQRVAVPVGEANATRNEIPRRNLRPQKKKVEVVGIVPTTVTSSSTTTTTERPLKKSYERTRIWENSGRSNLSNESRFTKGKLKEISGKEPPQAIKIDKSGETGGVPVRAIVEFGGTALAVLVILVLGFFWYKRRKVRKTERDNMVEDSDVRFLTSDEVLDFTLARPADDDL